MTLGGLVNVEVSSFSNCNIKYVSGNRTSLVYIDDGEASFPARNKYQTTWDIKYQNLLNVRHLTDSDFKQLNTVSKQAI